MKILVDGDKCQGHARCNVIAPELFGLDDMGHSLVLVDEVPPDLTANAERAVANCPEGAIRVS